LNVAIVHDYLTQRGGAERVVLAMRQAFPDAPIYTSLYDPDGTFPEFRDADVRTLPLDRVGLFARAHRLAMPLLAPAFSRLRVDADVLLCSSSGWAHGARTSGRKIVYCHAPARWLYQGERYVTRRGPASLALGVLRPGLLRWDRAAALSADRYLANSRAIRDQVRALYGIKADVLPPPYGLDPDGAREALAGIEPGFLLCVARLLPYKNVDAVVRAMRELADERLVVVGDGPEAEALRALAGPNVLFVSTVTDAQLRWLYASCAGAVSASYEDFGLVPLEAAAFGRPTAALRFGGFLDTIEDGRTGILFERPAAADIAAAAAQLRARPWDAAALQAHAAEFSTAAFVARLRRVVTGGY
jgi:glycosyltransferase involved in cell wall biosynthesis